MMFWLLERLAEMIHCITQYPSCMRCRPGGRFFIARSRRNEAVIYQLVAQEDVGRAKREIVQEIFSTDKKSLPSLTLCRSLALVE
jgi:hypothetical protein